MNVAKWVGILAAALALGCAGQQAETRTEAAGQRAGASAQAGGQSAGDAAAANEQAPSQRPSSGAGSQSPHPVATNPDDPQYGGDRSGEVARPGLEGRPGVQRGDSATGASAAASSGAGDVKELNEVYGQVNEVDKDEIEIEPAYGEPVKVKLNEQSMMGDSRASAQALQEGDEVRVSYDEQGGDKVAIEVQEDPPASTIQRMAPSSTSGSDTGSSTGSDSLGGTGGTGSTGPGSDSSIGTGTKR